jgi:hypothetical protein
MAFMLLTGTNMLSENSIVCKERQGTHPRELLQNVRPHAAFYVTTVQAYHLLVRHAPPSLRPACSGAHLHEDAGQVACLQRKLTQRGSAAVAAQGRFCDD